MFKFTVTKKSKKSHARTGIVKTPHGTITTPAFIPVATLGVIKGGLDYDETKKTYAQCQITNTFHFLDLDQADIVKRVGGLHAFFHFKKPIFTDSGGFQVFSLGKGTELGLGKAQWIEEPGGYTKKGTNLVKISEEGVSFRSPRDGRKISLTPEFSAQTQKKLGSDFMYLLDICGSVVDSHEQTAEEMERTHRWYKRFLSVSRSKNQQIFGIIQGGGFKDLRHVSTEMINNLDVFGVAIGGALGKSRSEMFKILSWIHEKVDDSRPRHLLGVGDLESIPEIVKRGIDLFDCALPSRIARHGTALTKNGYLSIKSQKYARVFKPLDKTCICFTCKTYTLAELNFLARGKEMLAGKLLTIHNLHFIEQQLVVIREQIQSGKL